MSSPSVERHVLGRVRAALTVVAVIAALLVPAAFDVAAASAATVPAGFVDSAYAGGVVNGTAMAFAPDGRLFVAQQGGLLRVVAPGGGTATTFTALSVDSNGERGLLGVALDPAFATNQYVYLYSTVPGSPAHNRVSRVTANGNSVVPGSEVTLVELDALSSATNHNGGALHFGPDAKLYVAVGDNANSANAQSLTTRHGKILRYNPDGTIPSDNPFVGSTSGAYQAIWALGLRNPFTFGFNPSTGRMFVNDVGQSTWEEINDGVAGANYGWPATEGTTSNPAYRSPLLAYAHGSSASTGCAITGGTFYQPPLATFPAGYVGRYFYADYCSGWIRTFDPATSTSAAFATGANAAVDLQVGPDGGLYYLSRGDSAVRAIRASGGTVAPVVTTDPVPRTTSVGAAATFSVVVSGTAPFTYQWQRNGSDIVNATQASYTVVSPQLADDGATFRVRVTNAAGSATSAAASLHVTPRVAPVAAFTAPATYAGGEQLNLVGTSTDVADGALAASAYVWTVEFHHDDHTHPFAGPLTNTATPTITVPVEGETSTNVYFRVTLTVQNSGGLTATTSRDIIPRIGRIQLRSGASDATFVVDGQPATGIGAVDVYGVVGMRRTIGAAPTLIRPGQLWAFSGWSDAGGVEHQVTIPTGSAIVTSAYSLVRTWPGNSVRRLRRHRIRPA